MPVITEIKELSVPELLPYTNTSELALKNERGLFVAESPKVIRTALDAGHEPVSLLVSKKYISGQAADIISRCEGIPVYTAESDVIEKLTGFKLTQGILSAMRRKPEPDISSILSGAKRIAVLEDIMNQTNTGAIFRSAAALGFDAVLLTDGCSDPLFRRSVRVSMGSVFLIPWCHIHGTSPEYVKAIKDSGFFTAAAALCEGSVSIDDKRLLSADRKAVFFGTENSGLRPETIKACDLAVKIPMSKGVDSLNAAAASAVIFWALSH